MKIAVIIVRILMGLLFTMSPVIYFFHLIPPPELEGDNKLFNEGVAAAGYLLPLLKGTELLCAVAFLSGRYVTLATVVIFPIVVNILLYHVSLFPSGLPVAIFLLLGDLFLAYSNRKNYESLFVAK